MESLVKMDDDNFSKLRTCRGGMSWVSVTHKDLGLRVQHFQERIG